MKAVLGNFIAWLFLLVSIPVFAYAEEWSWAAVSTILMGYMSIYLKEAAERAWFWRKERRRLRWRTK